MRYQIEYLSGADEPSVCHMALTDGSIVDATEQAWVHAHEAAGAIGFQIRDLEEGGAVVVLETFSIKRLLH